MLMIIIKELARTKDEILIKTLNKKAAEFKEIFLQLALFFKETFGL